MGHTTGTHSHQSPTASWAKQPDFRDLPSSSACSNTRIDLPQNRTHLPCRLICSALYGTHPRDLLGPRLVRQRSFVFLNCLRRVANSALTRWMVAEPICS